MGGGRIQNLQLENATELLEFRAQGLPFLRAPLGWLHRKIANYSALSTEDLASPKDRFIHYMRYVQKLLDDWDGSASVYIATNRSHQQA